MSRTYKILAVAVVAILAVGGYWKKVLSPKREQAKTLATQVQQQKLQLAQTQSLIAQYAHAKAQYGVNYATVVRLGKAIPADDDTRSLVVQLNAAARRSGVAFDNVDVTGGASSTGATATMTSGASNIPPGAVSAGSYSVLPLTLSFDGTFDGLSHFFDRLQRFVTVQGDQINVNGRLLRVESLDLTADESGWPGIQAQIGAASYIVPAGQAPASSTPSSTTTSATSSASASGSASPNAPTIP
jgi:Tfp pilus assembly protein PilO